MCDVEDEVLEMAVGLVVPGKGDIEPFAGRDHGFVEIDIERGPEAAVEILAIAVEA